MDPTRYYNTKLQLLFVRLGGHVLTGLFAVGFVLCAKFVPAPLPTASAADIAALYQENATGIRVGITVMLISFSLWAVWGAVIASWTTTIESCPPILTYTQLVCIAVAEMVGVLCAFFWGIAAYRPGVISPDITLTLNDMGWMMFLIPWAPYSLWCVALGLAILQDKNTDPLFPRWVAGVCFWTALLFVPAFAPLFFKTGGFAYNGLLGMYIPLAAFFVWIEVVSYTMSKRLVRGDAPLLSSALAQESGPASGKQHV